MKNAYIGIVDAIKAAENVKVAKPSQLVQVHIPVSRSCLQTFLVSRVTIFDEFLTLAAPFCLFQAFLVSRVMIFTGFLILATEGDEIKS